MASDPEIPPPASFEIVKTALGKVEQLISNRKELLKLDKPNKEKQKRIKSIDNFLQPMIEGWCTDVNGKYFDVEEAEAEIFQKVKYLAPDATEEQLLLLVEVGTRLTKELISIHLQRYAS